MHARAVRASSSSSAGGSSPASSLAFASASASAVRFASRLAKSASAFWYSASTAAFCVSISPQSIARSTLVATRKAKSNLSCSNSERHTIW